MECFYGSKIMQDGREPGFKSIPEKTAALYNAAIFYNPVTGCTKFK